MAEATTPNVKLTKIMREAIARRAINASFDPKAQALAQEEDRLAREAYEACYTADEREQADAIPKYWLRRDPCLNFNVGGFRIRLCTITDHLPVPYQAKGDGYGGYSCHPSHGTITEGDLHDRIRAHAVAGEALKQSRVETERRLLAMLSSVGSLKKLREVWPEGEAFYSQYEVKPVALPPAIRMDEINAALGLPVAA